MATATSGSCGPCGPPSPAACVDADLDADEPPPRRSSCSIDVK